MPRVEKELVPDGGFRNFDYLGVPRDAVNPRLIVEWDEPPKNDWTPKDVAQYEHAKWKNTDANKRVYWEGLSVQIANKIAELERAKCAEVVRKRSQLWNAGDSVEELMNLCADAILARTNDNAGYPRMEK